MSPSVRVGFLGVRLPSQFLLLSWVAPASLRLARDDGSYACSPFLLAARLQTAYNTLRTFYNCYRTSMVRLSP